MSITNSTFAIVSWTLYVLGVCLIISRIVFRRMTLGCFSKLQYDDWLMIFVLLPFTGTIVSANQASIHWDTNWGLRMRFALEEFHVTTTWLVKGCLLILYRRIFPSVTSEKQRQYLAWISAYCILTYVAVQILLPLWCRPINEYFDPLSANTQCKTYHNHALTTLVFGLTTTLTILIYPIPFVPTPRKILLALLFLLGLFVLSSGILSRYYILADPSSQTYLPWYIAEATGTICFANLPFLSSLIASTSPLSTRRRHFSTNLTISRNHSLSQWPGSSTRCSIKASSPPVRFQRLNSAATTVGSITLASSPPPPVHKEPEKDDWSDAGFPSSEPPMQIFTLRPTDPPPELEVFWSRRPSLRNNAEEEKFGIAM